MTYAGRRVVTGHDAHGVSVALTDGPPPQDHPMRGAGIGADFLEIWHETAAVPVLGAVPPGEPNAQPFAMMPPTGHRLRILDVYPLSQGGSRTVMHRTSTLDYVVVIEGQLTLILEEGEATLGPGDVVVQRGTNHAWENRSDRIARGAFFHLAAEFDPALAAMLPQPLELMR